MHILPDLAASQRSMPSTGALILAERHIYIVAMIGLVGFYGLERMVRRATGGSERGSGEVPGPGVYHLHIGSFALYNLLIGNLLLHREEATLRSLLLYTLAMGFHFVVTDYGLRQDHRENYHRTGRWILAGAIMLGWGLGMVVVLHRLMVDELFALLAGSVILNVLKEELPEERKSRFSAFVAGAAGYSALLLWWT